MNTCTKHLASGMALGVFLLLFCASKTQKHSAAPALTPVKVANYDYVPPESPTKASITLALVRPIFAPSMKYSDLRLFSDFSRNMGADFEEMLTRRGYTVRGPFQLPDDMVYDDKKSCPLYLHPQIQCDLDFSNVNYHVKSKVEFDGRQTHTVYYYWYEGSVTITSHISLYFVEPFSREKIKTLSISSPQKVAVIKSEKIYRENNFYNALRMHEDAGIINPLVAALEEQYQSCFTTAYNHLDPREVSLYVNDAKNARDNKK